MFCSRGGSVTERVLASIGAAVVLAVGVALLGGGASSAQTPATSTTWSEVASNCGSPPSNAPSGNWVQKGNGCWDQSVSYGGWTVNDGSASNIQQPGFTVNMTWTVPGSIGSAAATANLAVSVTGGVAQRICVLQAYTSFTVAGGDSCATTSVSMPSATAAASIQPMDAADGSLAYVWVSLGDGGNVFYTYKASTPTTCSPPPGIGSASKSNGATCRQYAVKFDVHVAGFPDSPPASALGSYLVTVDVQSQSTKLVWDPAAQSWMGAGRLDVTTTYLYPVAPHLREEDATISLDAAAQGYQGSSPESASYFQSPTKRVVTVPGVVLSSSDDSCYYDARLRITLGVAKGKATLRFGSTLRSCLSSTVIWYTHRIRSAHIHPPV